jgi:hypothetical protein
VPGIGPGVGPGTPEFGISGIIDDTFKEGGVDVDVESDRPFDMPGTIPPTVAYVNTPIVVIIIPYISTGYPYN